MQNLYVVRMRIGEKEYLGVGIIGKNPLEKQRVLFPDGTKRGIIVFFSFGGVVQVLHKKVGG